MRKTLWLLLLISIGLRAEIVSLSDANYKEKIDEHKKVVLLFSAPWCGACKDMHPVYQKFSSNEKEQTLFTEINTDENEKLSSKYKIESLPTLVILENGKEVKRSSGSLDMDELELFINTKKVINEYSKKCDNGESPVCVLVGELYEEGELVKKDYAKALVFYEKSCTLKNAKGCMYLAYMYDEAIGVKQDYVVAKKYYEQSCDGKNIIACRFLGYMYDNGLGMKKDYIKAHELYVKSCKGEDEYACNNLGHMYSEGNGVSKDLKKALSFYELSCTFGYDNACDEVTKLKK